MNLSKDSITDWVIGKPSKGDLLPCLLILSAIALMAWRGTVNKANTTDELVHVLAGHAAWTLQDYRLNPENGTLPGRIAAAPLQWAQGIASINTASEDWKSAQQWSLGNHWWFWSGMDHRKVLQLSHMAMLLFNLTGLALVYVWSALFWGRGGAYFSLLLAGFSPNFLGHVPLATSDFAGAWTLVLAVFAFVRLTGRISLWNIVGAGIAAGVALLCKHSGIILGPIALILILWRVSEGVPIKVVVPGLPGKVAAPLAKLASLVTASALACGVSILVIWAAYSWRYTAANPAAGEFHQFQIAWDQLPELSLQPVIELFRQWKLLPEAFLYGLNFILSLDSRGGFLNGEYSVNGFHFYHFWTFLYKTPPVALILHITGIACFVTFLFGKRGFLNPYARGIVVLGCIYCIMLWPSKISIGHRHIFVLIYLSTICAGICLPRLIENRFRLGIFLLILPMSMIPTAWLNIDRTISYVNFLGGGAESGYHRLADSSLDWGQDLPSAVVAIEEFRQAKPDKTIYLAYFGSANPLAHGLKDVEHLPSWGSWQRQRFSPKLEEGLYVISATALVTTRKSWTPELERAYQLYRQKAKPIYSRLLAEGHLPLEAAVSAMKKEEVELLESYEYLRFQRLKNYLQGQKPEKILNGSILAYEVTDEELDTF